MGLGRSFYCPFCNSWIVGTTLELHERDDCKGLYDKDNKKNGGKE